YSITTQADISIIATAKNGNKQVKTYRQSNSIEGPFSATNAKITSAVNSALTDVISDMADDTSIHEFIKQNAH
ncbi:YajG family lipoprotein, partial [Rosenbergiella collisarenosi]